MFSIITRIATWFAAGLAARLLTSLGLGIYTASAINDIVSAFIASFDTAIRSLPADALALMGLAGIDNALTTIIAAITTVAYLKAFAVLFGKAGM